MLNDRKTLGEYFKNDPSLFTEGKGLDSQRSIFEMPWIDDADFAEYCLPALDELYAARSYEKYAGRLIKRFAGTDALTQADVDHLAMNVIALFFDKWCKEWRTRSIEYNPIDNYNMTEIMSDDEKVTEYGRTNTRTDNLQHTTSGSETETKNLTTLNTQNLSEAETKNLSDAETKNLTETTTPNLTTTEERHINGFNSSASIGVPDGNTTTQATGTNTVNNTGTDTTLSTGTDTTLKTGTETVDQTGTDTTQQTGTDTMLHTGTDTTLRTGTDKIDETGTDGYSRTGSASDTGTETHALSGSDTETRNYELTRQGNIGVTTTQQMLQSERDLWKWNYFTEVVFPDLDSVFTLKIY